MRRYATSGARHAVVALLALACGPALAAPGPVVVTVRSPTGQALAGVRVSVLAEAQGEPDYRHPVRLAAGVTGEDGTARLAGLDPSTPCTLVATPPDQRWRDFADLCTPGWKAADTTLEMPPAYVLTGVVRDAAGRAVPHALVRAEVPPLHAATLSAADGTFAFENLPTGEARLHAEIQRGRGTPLRSEPVRAATYRHGVVVAMPSPVPDRRPMRVVRVRTPNGRPVAHGQAYFHITKTEVTRIRPFISHGVASTPVEGGAAHTSELRGRVWLEVLGARTEFGEPLPFGPARRGPYEPGALEETITLPPEEVISGTVSGPDGKPQMGIRVEAVLARPHSETEAVMGRWTRAPHGEDTSGPDGRFRVGGLERADYDVRARPTPDLVPTDDVRIPAGSTGVEIRVRDAAKPRITVRDPLGRPLHGAVVQVRGPPRFAHPGRAVLPMAWRTDAGGRARLAGLDPQVRYEMEVRPPKQRAELLEYRSSAWKPEDTVVPLERARSIRGIVHDQRGRPVPRARLTWAHVRESVAERITALTAEAGPDGRFTLKRLYGGSYRIWVRAPSREPARAAARIPSEASIPEDAEPTIVRSGSTSVVLTAQLPSRLRFRVRGWDRSVRRVPALLVPEDPKRERKPLVGQLDESGLVVFEDLPCDVTYAFWLGVPQENAYVYVTGIVVDDDRRDLTLEEGTVVSGRILAPRGTKSRKVHAAYPGFAVAGRLKAAGRFEIRGLPPGPWTIRASGRKDGTTLHGETEALVAEDVEVTLGP